MRLGERITSREILKVDRRLHSIYRAAKKELEDTLADFNRKYAVKDKQKKALVDSGEMSLQEYKDWQAGQVFIRKQWQDKIDSVCKILNTHTQRAAEIVRKGQFTVFAENYNVTAMEAERKTGISFNIYNTDTVAELIEEDPQTLPEWRIDEKKDYAWNKRKVNNSITQGIIQGDSIEDITRRLCEKLCTQNENRMRLFARTAMTGAQNAGRQKHMDDAAKKGIQQNKRWLATLDGRTRDTHRHLDGKEVPYNEPFKSDLGLIMFPGDPSAEPGNVYNCRCSIVTIYPEYEDYSKRDWREDEIIDGQTYEEWKKGKIKKGQVVQTGGKYAVLSKKWTQWKENRSLQAEKYYERVRRTDDVKKISKTSGFTQKQIQIIKDHIFYKEDHKLYDGVGRFEADYDMAVAWKRLSDGKPEKRDILLLKHELLEARVEKRYNLTVAEAHAIAKKRYPWDTVLEELLGEDGEEDDLL